MVELVFLFLCLIDTVQFGITQAVLRVTLQPLIKKLDPNQSGIVKKVMFMRFKQCLPDWVCG